MGELERINFDWDVNFPLLKLGDTPKNYPQDNNPLSPFSRRPCLIYEIKPKVTLLKDHPVAYESTDEGAQGTTSFLYTSKDIIIEVYDAMDNYVTITIYCS